jgi:uncharacterized protein
MAPRELPSRPVGANPDDLAELTDADLGRQVAGLELAVRTNPFVEAIIGGAGSLGLPGWYLGAGCITNTLWNLLHGFDPVTGVKDYDLVYFDDGDLTAEAEQAMETKAQGLFRELGVQLDVTNEARVHLWYESRFGRPLPPYRSTEHAIRTWPTTASSVGVRRDAAGFRVCAPFGLRDLFAMVVRPNKTVVTRAVYEAKVARWSALWPRLTVVPWG